MPATVPAALTVMESHAEDIYDTILAREWQQAASAYAWFSGGLQRVDSAVRNQQAGRDDLRSQVVRLGEAISARDRQQALLAANQTAWQATQLAEPYHPSVPIAVARLDYLGRQLQVWADAGDAAQLQATAADVQQTWRDLRPQVVGHGGTQQAQHFDQLATQLRQADTPAAYGRLATPILDAVDNLEQVFARPAAGTV